MERASPVERDENKTLALYYMIRAGPARLESWPEFRICLQYGVKLLKKRSLTRQSEAVGLCNYMKNFKPGLPGSRTLLPRSRQTGLKIFHVIVSQMFTDFMRITGISTVVKYIYNQGLTAQKQPLWQAALKHCKESELETSVVC